MDYSTTIKYHSSRDAFPSTRILLELLSDEAKMAVQQAQRMMQAQQLVAFNQPQLMAAQPNASLRVPALQQTGQTQQHSAAPASCATSG